MTSTLCPSEQVGGVHTRMLNSIDVVENWVQVLVVVVVHLK